MANIQGDNTWNCNCQVRTIKLGTNGELLDSATDDCANAAYAQCGGVGWTGQTCCPSGYSCAYSNDYYSQCIPSGVSNDDAPPPPPPSDDTSPSYACELRLGVCFNFLSSNDVQSNTHVYDAYASDLVTGVESFSGDAFPNATSALSAAVTALFTAYPSELLKCTPHETSESFEFISALIPNDLDPAVPQ